MLVCVQKHLQPTARVGVQGLCLSALAVLARTHTSSVIPVLCQVGQKTEVHCALHLFMSHSDPLIRSGAASVSGAVIAGSHRCDVKLLDGLLALAHDEAAAVRRAVANALGDAANMVTLPCRATCVLLRLQSDAYWLTASDALVALEAVATAARTPRQQESLFVCTAALLDHADVRLRTAASHCLVELAHRCIPISIIHASTSSQQNRSVHEKLRSSALVSHILPEVAVRLTSRSNSLRGAVCVISDTATTISIQNKPDMQFAAEMLPLLLQRMSTCFVDLPTYIACLQSAAALVARRRRSWLPLLRHATRILALISDVVSLVQHPADNFCAYENVPALVALQKMIRTMSSTPTTTVTLSPIDELRDAACEVQKLSWLD